MNPTTPLRRRYLWTSFTVCSCLLTSACGHSKPATVGSPATSGASRAPDPASATDGRVSAGAAAAASATSGSSGATRVQKPVCSLITVTEMAAILEAPIGKPSEDDSPGTTSCVYPPADAGSYQQAHIEIQWNHDSDLSPEQQLADALGGVAGHAVAHNSALADDSTYSIDGVLKIRTGRTLIAIELPMRPDSEGKAVAIGKLLLGRLGVPEANPTANDETGRAPVTNAASAGPAATPKFPEGLHVGEACSEVAHGPPAEESALVPLKIGLTLSNIWNGGDDNYDHELLVQIVAVTDAYIDITQSGPRGADHHNVSTKRRICRAALRDSYFYRTETSLKEPPVVSPATMFSLSTRSLHELKTAKLTRHRYIEIDDDWSTMAQPLVRDVDEVLSSTRFDRESYSVIVNGRTVELPVVVALGGGNKDWQTMLKAVDDERFPLVLYYEIPGYGLKIRYTKISYPTDDEMEKQLATDKHVDVYGIYFDFASDRLRAESTPVLAEIAGVLKKNTDWKLSINGHTDNVGGDIANLDLSRKRALSVKAALVDRYGIAEGRLTTGGFGASQPHEKNDTPEGRARNRRVELTRS